MADNQEIVSQRDGEVRITCRVQPRAGRSKVKGIQGGSLRIALAAPPVDGRANEELREFLSDTLGIPKSAVTIVHGEKGRDKIVACTGIDRATALAKLGIAEDGNA